MTKRDKIFGNGEINIRFLINLIFENKYYILKFLLFFIFLSVFYIRSQDPLYKTSISFSPYSSEGSGDLNNILDLASNIGISLDNSTTMSLYIPDIVDSRRLKEEIVDTIYHTNKFEPDLTTLITYWEIDKTKSFSFSKIKLISCFR